MKTLPLALLLAALLFGTAHAQVPPQPLDGIAAVVDEDVILRSELDRAVANILTQYANRQNQLPPRDVLQRQVLERLILVRLQTARAQSTGVRVSDEEIDDAVTNIAQQNNLTPEQLRQQLARDGTSYADFRNSLRDELLIQRLRQRFAQSRISVSDAEVDAAVAAQTSRRAVSPRTHPGRAAGRRDAGADRDRAAEDRRREGPARPHEMPFQRRRGALFRQSQCAGRRRPRLAQPRRDSGRVRQHHPQRCSPVRSSARCAGPSGFQLLQLVETREGEQAQAQQRHPVPGPPHPGPRQRRTTSATPRRRRRSTPCVRGSTAAPISRRSRRKIRTTRVSTRQGRRPGLVHPGRVRPGVRRRRSRRCRTARSRPPFKTQAGWHIVQRIGTRQTDVSDDNQRAQVRETIGQRKLEDEWNRFLRETARRGLRRHP